MSRKVRWKWTIKERKTFREDILRPYYIKERNPSAYSSANRLYNVFSGKKYDPGVFTTSYSNQDAYSLQESRRHRFKTANVRVTAIGEELDLDLLSMSNLAVDTDGIDDRN